MSICIHHELNRLAAYGLKAGLFEKEDLAFVKNQFLLLLNLDGFENDDEVAAVPEVEISDLEDILKNILDYAVAHNLVGGDGTVYRDLFDTRLMSVMVDRPANIIRKFNELYAESPKKATDFFYKLSQDSDYIRRYRVCKDLKWVSKTQYGDMDITINLSKPEKDPKAIAAAKLMKQSGYPKCLLCKENEGYAGRVNHPARENHRIIPIELAGEKWGFQYSPYVYYNEHCIVFNYEHTPMLISKKTFQRLLDFVDKFPHYTIGSNADLPIVGGSILTHDHFQGGAYEFPMAKAPVDKEFSVKGYEDVKCGIVKWPMSVIRVSSAKKERLVEFAEHVLEKWRAYTDENAFIFAETDGEKHNTLNPIARRRGSDFELDLVLRNNITTKEHPLGFYHPHAELHHIKKENIGLIEVMGLAILPGRLKTELSELTAALKEGRDISSDESLAKHSDWVAELKQKYDFASLSPDKIDGILKDEIGHVFSKVLEHAGVYKYTEEGKTAFKKFIETL
ncbi:UDP-glucose--hexose-1-phosphate uridylyltransferase [Treponema sp.]|uniref:UDP-glucose--hexose-1-phosphate uridylyltransferase n=1 Tax=Treponema sp. TaxID=166 RepID=UPI0025E4023C|nr:UDP-glucose--hexose-1-phosphate uridylyltransferase [Treponema sp.]